MFRNSPIFGPDEPTKAYHVYTEGYSGGRTTIGYFRQLADAKQAALDTMEDIFPGNFKPCLLDKGGYTDYMHIETSPMGGKAEFFYCVIDEINIQ